MKLVVIASHPIQYYAPWFRWIHQNTDVQLHVLYLWNPSGTHAIDPSFGQPISWDVDLLSGYPYMFLRNTSPNPGTHHFNGLRNPELIDYLQRLRPDAILFTTLFQSSLLRHLLLQYFPSVPKLFRGDSHWLGREESFFHPRHLLKRWVYRQFEAILTVGEANRLYYRRLGIPANRLFHSPHAVDNQRFQGDTEELQLRASDLRHSLGIPPESLVFLFVGKLTAGKNPLSILRAFQQSQRAENSTTPAHLIFCGTGDIELELKQLSASHPRIHFLGFQNQQQMPVIYRAANLLLLPTAETWGLSVNEAFACGCPALVSTRTGCAEDLIHPYKTGLLVRHDSESDLTGALQWAQEHPEHLRAMGLAAYHKIQEYSYERATLGLLQALNALGTQQ
ncbi:MAG: glycosyltransferase family 4 protein [Candidatus Sumerlaeia bacterium]|nr:glycosyltransferase family 4 protein [Candidatus Sumerlaeia bacterium]